MTIIHHPMSRCYRNGVDCGWGGPRETKEEKRTWTRRGVSLGQRNQTKTKKPKAQETSVILGHPMSIIVYLLQFLWCGRVRGGRCGGIGLCPPIVPSHSSSSHPRSSHVFLIPIVVVLSSPPRSDLHSGGAVVVESSYIFSPHCSLFKVPSR